MFKREQTYGPLPELAAALADGTLSPGVFRELTYFPQNVQRAALRDREFLRVTLRWQQAEKRALRRFQAVIRSGLKPSRTTKPTPSA